MFNVQLQTKAREADSTAQEDENQASKTGTSSAAEHHASTNGDVSTSGPVEPAKEPNGTTESRKKIGRIIMRTVFCDDVVLSSTGNTKRLKTLGLQDAWSLAKHRACTQVVQLGAGMDTRAWRLDLPQGVAWFEVDQPHVLKAKRRVMSSAGAGFSKADSDVTFPLRASSYVTVGADLQKPAWTKKLIKAGFDTSKPTCWVCEGLLYYMEQDSVAVMLESALFVSAPGSVMVATSVSRAVTDRAIANAKPGDIMGSWKWGVPGDTDTWHLYFDATGWKTVSTSNWADIAEEYGMEPDMGVARRARLSGAVTNSGDASTAPTNTDQSDATTTTEDMRKRSGLVLLVKV